MSSVKLVAHTVGVGELEGKSIGEILAYVARVSNPGNQHNHETAPKLLKYCAKNSHWSVFETVYITMEIRTSVAIATQILRHKTACFQQFCVTGDTKVTTVLGKRSLPNYITIKKLYDRQGWKNYKNVRVKVYNESTKEFSNSKISKVFYTGEQPVYKVTLACGKTITCTEKERFFTREGTWVQLDELVGLSKTCNNTATMTKKAYVATNGIPCHQDYTWMHNIRSEKPKLSVQQIADKAGVSYHTIRKWLKIHGLQFNHKEVAEIFTVWNKGKFGYKTSLVVSESHKNAIRKAKSGPNSNFWKGGVDRGFRLGIADWCATIRTAKLKACGFKCIVCGSSRKLELDHIKPVYSHPELAKDENNIQVLCSACHDNKHNLAGDPKIWKEKAKGGKLIPKYSLIAGIEYMGIQPTYDMEVEGDHNYIANKILVHNSQRYSEIGGFELYEARRQDDKNRQNSIDDLSEDVKEWFDEAQRDVQAYTINLYQEALDKGIAKECARFLLPQGTSTTLYMTANVRTWITYLWVRSKDAGAQAEHVEIADKCKAVLLELAPELESILC